MHTNSLMSGVDNMNTIVCSVGRPACTHFHVWSDRSCGAFHGFDDTQLAKQLKNGDSEKQRGVC